MRTEGLTVRDKIVLAAGWGLVLGAAVAFWANTTYVNPRSYGNRGPDLQQWYVGTPETSRHLSEAILIALLGVALLGCAAFASPRIRQLLSGVGRGFQARPTLHGLLVAYVLVQLFALDGSELLTPFSVYLLTLSLVLIAIWFIVGRVAIDLRLLILTATWLVALNVAAGVFHDATGQINILTSSWRARIFALAGISAFGVLLALPVVLTLQRARELGGKLIALFQAWSPWAFFASWASMLVIEAFLAWGSPQHHVILRIMLKPVTLVVVITLGGLVSIAYGSAMVTRRPSFRDMGGKLFAAAGLLLAGAYVLAAIHIARNQLYALSPDTVDYLVIARKYASGDFVVRGYWSPLVSWVMAPMIALGMDAQVSLRVLGGVAGALWVFVADRLALKVGLRRSSRLILAMLMMAVSLSVAFNAATPDLIGAVFVSIFIYCLFRLQQARSSLWTALLIGIPATLAYFAKYYNVVFVVSNLILTGTLLALRRHRPRFVLAATGAALAVVAVGVTPWVLAIHERYGQYTISTSGPITRARLSPRWAEVVVTALWDTPPDLLVPSEDPQARAYPGYGWSAFDSLDDFRYQLNVIYNNLRGWASTTLLNLGTWPVMSLVIVALVVAGRMADRERITWGIWVIGSVLVYISGYMVASPFSSDFRYYLPIIPVLLLTTVLLLQDFSESFMAAEAVRNRFVRSTVGALLLVMPLSGLGLLRGLTGLWTTPVSDCQRVSAQSILNVLVEPIAGIDLTNSYLAYYTWKRTVGFLPNDSSPANADAQLKTFQVKTFVIPATLPMARDLVELYHYPVVASTDACGKAYIVLRVPQ